jgi:deoxycytidylate deaminase
MTNNTILEDSKMENLKRYIKMMVDAVAGPSLKPCIKQEVRAMLVTVEGLCFFGANWMSNGDVTVCPRVTAGSPSGFGYELCVEVCNQLFHAERSAIDACINGGFSPVGGTMYVIGHTYCCKDCRAAMKANGIIRALVIDSGKEYDHEMNE